MRRGQLAARAVADAVGMKPLAGLAVRALDLVRVQPLHHIARAAPTCKVVSVAARNAIKVRQFSGEVVTLAGHTGAGDATCVAAAPDGREEASPARPTGPSRCGATARASAPSRRTQRVNGGGGAAGRSALRQRLERRHREAVDARRRSRAHLRGGHPTGVLRRGAARRRALCGRPWHAPRDEVRLYHVDGTLVHTFKGHTNAVRAVAVTPDGQHIISGSADKLVKVWSVATKSLVSTCAGHTGDVRAVAAMPDGQRILSGSATRPSACGSSTAPSRTPSSCTPATGDALVALPDNQHALSGSRDKTVKLFNVNDGAVLRTFKHHTDWRCSAWRCCPTASGGSRTCPASPTSVARAVRYGITLVNSWLACSRERATASAAAAASNCASLQRRS